MDPHREERLGPTGTTGPTVPMVPTGRRGGSTRDRRGRGMRGQPVLPGPLTPRGVPRTRSRRDRFDTIALDVVSALEARWSDELGLLEFVVEETPLVPDDWAAATVPLSSVVRRGPAEPTRLVLFRRPIELRCETSSDLQALIHTVLVEQVSELLGRPPEEIDPRYDVG
jgi:Zincin-like metallopeptidase